MTARPRALPPLLLTALLHGALLLAVLHGIHTQRQQRPRGPVIQWLLPSTAAPITVVRPRLRASVASPASPSRTRPARADPEHQARPRTIPAAPTSGVSAPPARAPVKPAEPVVTSAVPTGQAAERSRDDPFAPDQPAAARTAPASSDELLQQARRSAGRIDQQLRAESPQRFPLPPPDSLQARLERGINAAHEAVPPKWYQGARMVELSTPDSERKSRLYKISTAFGSYCVSISPEGRRSYSNCP